MSPLTRLLKYILPNLHLVILGTLCALVIALCEVGYVSLLAETVDAIKLVDAQGLPVKIDLFSDLISGFSIQIRNEVEARKLISFVAISLLALILIKGAFFYAHTYLMASAGEKVIMRLRIELYERITQMPLGLLTKQRTGDLMSRVISDVASVQGTIGNASGTVRAIITVVAFMVRMFTKSWKLTLLTILVFPAIGYLINDFGKRLRKTSRDIQTKVADISTQLEQTLFGIKIIKSFVLEAQQSAKFAQENRRIYRMLMRRARLHAMLVPLVEMFAAIGLVSVFWLGCWQIIHNQLSTGWFIGFIAMVGMIYKPIKTMGSFHMVLQQGLASADRIFEILDMPLEPTETSDALQLPLLKGDVEFRNVSFSYGKEEVLKNINLKVRSGEIVAIVGPSGSGKSTLVNLIPRFYELTQGEILIDGRLTSKLSLKSLRSQIALVPQEMILFGGTVLENISYGNPKATREQIIEAAKGANAHDFIIQLPHGYETQIGERGTQISGGQQQRISMARALLKDPKILILDEATSALDSKSEALVQESLNHLMKGRTTFVIAHRLSTVTHADKIVVLDKGEMVEQGVHSELIAQNSLYRKLYETQFNSI